MFKNSLSDCMSFVAFRSACVFNAISETEQWKSLGFDIKDVFSEYGKVALITSVCINLDVGFHKNAVTEIRIDGTSPVATVDLMALTCLKNIIMSKTTIKESIDNSLKSFTKISIADCLKNIIRFAEISATWVGSETTENGHVITTSVGADSARVIYGKDAIALLNMLVSSAFSKVDAGPIEKSIKSSVATDKLFQIYKAVFNKMSSVKAIVDYTSSLPEGTDKSAMAGYIVNEVLESFALTDDCDELSQSCARAIENVTWSCLHKYESLLTDQTTKNLISMCKYMFDDDINEIRALFDGNDKVTNMLDNILQHYGTSNAIDIPKDECAGIIKSLSHTTSQIAPNNLKAGSVISALSNGSIVKDFGNEIILTESVFDSAIVLKDVLDIMDHEGVIAKFTGVFVKLDGSDGQNAFSNGVSDDLENNGKFSTNDKEKKSRFN